MFSSGLHFKQEMYGGAAFLYLLQTLSLMRWDFFYNLVWRVKKVKNWKTVPFRQLNHIDLSNPELLILLYLLDNDKL